ncbi:MAG: ADP-ribosylation factor-like protein, partial [Candidatus Hodarchaeota archaeon]
EQRRWKEAIRALKELLTSLENKIKPFSLSLGIIANKIDTVPQYYKNEILNQLFVELKEEGAWELISSLCSAYKVFGTSALTGEGVEEVLEWLYVTSTGKELSKQLLLKEVHLIEESGISLSYWIRTPRKETVMDGDLFSSFVT